MQTCSGNTVWKAAVFDMKCILSGQAQDAAPHFPPTGTGGGEESGAVCLGKCCSVLKTTMASGRKSMSFTRRRRHFIKRKPLP
jgi:hypothetical protein